MQTPRLELGNGILVSYLAWAWAYGETEFKNARPRDFVGQHAQVLGSHEGHIGYTLGLVTTLHEKMVVEGMFSIPHCAHSTTAVPINCTTHADTTSLALSKNTGGT